MYTRRLFLFLLVAVIIVSVVSHLVTPHQEDYQMKKHQLSAYPCKRLTPSGSKVKKRT